MFRYLSPLTTNMMTLGHRRLGAIVTPDSSRRLPPTMAWAADNGCFSPSKPKPFDLDRYLRWLAKPVGSLELCLFATAPDVVGDWAATWARSQPVLPQLRGLGYRAAVVLQNGVTLADLERIRPEIDAVFVGGDNVFKLADSTYALVAWAKQHGLYAHMGRVNGELRLRFAMAGAYDSADGSGLAYAPDALWPRVTGWLDRLDSHPPQGRPRELGLVLECAPAQRPVAVRSPAPFRTRKREPEMRIGLQMKLLWEAV